MALTLQQRVNLAKSRSFSATDATFIEKMEQCIRAVAQDILDEAITPSDAVFTGHPVSVNQMKEWALRALRGNWDTQMLPMIMDRPVLGADPTAATDANMRTAVRNSLWPFITLIGNGLL
jgi:hypothetical protein